MKDKKTNIKIIIGAGNGDEGKGLATDYFCNPSEKWLGVLTNGTSQRAHTVDTIDGKHHVFSHFSSGTLQGADTYISKYFAINPITFVNEYFTLQTKFKIEPKVYIHPDCKIITPFDILANLMERQEKNIHNTCGNGFWKTIERYNNQHGIITISSLSSNQNWLKVLNEIEKYYQHQLKDCKLDFTGIKEHFIYDLLFLFDHSLIMEEGIFKAYPNIVFENGQGLLIGEQNPVANWDYCTPSNTGISYAYDMIESNFTNANVEVCYVSRTYLTRHGDGELKNECAVEDINKKIIDLTNVPNECQGSLRYAPFNDKQLIDNVWQDTKLTSSSPFNKNKYKHSLMLTHWNEKQIDLTDIKTCHLFDGSIYISKWKTKESVRRI